MAEPRRLPVLQNRAPSSTEQDAKEPPLNGPDETEHTGPAWHWSLFGAVLIFSILLPLTMVAGTISQSLLAPMIPGTDPQQIQDFLAKADSDTLLKIRVAQVAPQLTAFALAAFIGGGLVGRFGGTAGAKEGAVAGLVVASSAWALTAATAGLAATWMIWAPLASIGAGFAYLGARFGLKRRQAAKPILAAR